MNYIGTIYCYTSSSGKCILAKLLEIQKREDMNMLIRQEGELDLHFIKL